MFGLQENLINEISIALAFQSNTFIYKSVLIERIDGAYTQSVNNVSSFVSFALRKMKIISHRIASHTQKIPRESSVKMLKRDYLHYTAFSFQSLELFKLLSCNLILKYWTCPKWLVHRDGLTLNIQNTHFPMCVCTVNDYVQWKNTFP